MKMTARIVISMISVLALSSFSSVGAQHESTINDNEIKLVDFEDLTYPTPARTAHIEGVVVVRASLNDKGKVVEVTAVSGNDVFIPECLANARKWRFQPNAMKAVVIVYNFRMTYAVSKSGCSQFMLQAPNFATITSCVPTIQ
jgi:TonB family protein